MKLIDAVDIAKGCGLTTIKEAYANIDIHAMQIFSYDSLKEELQELYEDTLKVFTELDIDVREDITIKQYEESMRY